MSFLVKSAFPLGLAFLVTSLWTATGELPAGWNSHYLQVLGEAKTNRSPVLIYFTASWCGPCQRMARTTLIDGRVAAALETIPHLALDIDEEPILSQKHGVRAVPTFQMVLPPAEVTASLAGFQEPEALAAWLTNHFALAKETLRQHAEIALRLEELERTLRGGESLSRSNAVAGMLDLFTEPADGIREKISARLNALPAQDVPWLLPGLNHRALAARIAAANFLRARVGEAFDIDPWEEAATRHRKVEEWWGKISVLELK